MIEFKSGEVFEVSFVKEGVTDRGEWQIVKVDDPTKKSKGNAAFFADPVIHGLAAHDKIRIDAFSKAAVKRKQMKLESTGKLEWLTVTDLTFQITKVGEADVPQEEVNTDGELPF